MCLTVEMQFKVRLGISATRKLLRHSNVKTTQIYAKIVNSKRESKQGIWLITNLISVYC